MLSHIQKIFLKLSDNLGAKVTKYKSEDHHNPNERLINRLQMEKLGHIVINKWTKTPHRVTKLLHSIVKNNNVLIGKIHEEGKPIVKIRSGLTGNIHLITYRVNEDKMSGGYTQRVFWSNPSTSVFSHTSTTKRVNDKFDCYDDQELLFSFCFLQDELSKLVLCSPAMQHCQITTMPRPMNLSEEIITKKRVAANARAQNPYSVALK